MMKTIFVRRVVGAVAVVCFAFAAPSQAEDSNDGGGRGSPIHQKNTDVSAFTGVEHTLYKSGGFLYYLENGKVRRLDKDLRVSDRVTVRANGSILKDGNPFTLDEGQMLLPDGRLESTPVGFSLMWGTLLKEARLGNREFSSGLAFSPPSRNHWPVMGRQWLHAKRAVASLKKSQATGKIVKEIMVAAKLGGPDPTANARLFAAMEKARRESVSREAIERGIKKGAGLGGEKLEMEHIVYEGYTPHKVPVIVEALTDKPNRTGPEIRVLFRKGQLGAAGSNKFLFDHVGLVEAYHSDGSQDLEEAAIEAGADEVFPLSHDENDDIPKDVRGGRFVTDRVGVHPVSQWLTSHGWTVVTSELGYLPKNFPDLTDEQRAEVGEFLQELDDNDDVHRVWAALK